MLLLPLILGGILAAGYESRHDDPFGDGGTVDSRDRRDRDLAVFQDRVIRPVVDAGREEMDQLEAGCFVRLVALMCSS